MNTLPFSQSAVQQVVSKAGVHSPCSLIFRIDAMNCRQQSATKTRYFSKFCVNQIEHKGQRIQGSTLKPSPPDKLEQVQWRATEMVWGWSTCLWVETDSWSYSSWRTDSFGNVSAHELLTENTARFFTAVHSRRMRDNQHKLNQEWFQMNRRENIFFSPRRTVQQWLSMGVVPSFFFLGGLQDLTRQSPEHPGLSS